MLAKSEYFETFGGGFLIDKQPFRVSYVLDLKPLKTLPSTTWVIVSFENPRGGPPIIMEQAMTLKDGRLILESKPIKGLQSHHDYQVQVSIYADSSKATLLGTHTQLIQSGISQDNVERLIPLSERYEPSR